MSKPSDISVRRAAARANADPDYNNRRTELLAAAARVFRRKGFSGAKLQDVAEEAGMDRASLYYYTSGKEELFENVVREAVRDIVSSVEELQRSDAPADIKLQSFIALLMRSYEHHYPYLYVFVQENMAHMTDETAWNHDMIMLSRRFDVAARAVVQEGLDSGLFTSQGDARLITNAIIGMCNWSSRWFQPGKYSSGEAIGDVFAELILRGLQPRHG